MDYAQLNKQLEVLTDNFNNLNHNLTSSAGTIRNAVNDLKNAIDANNTNSEKLARKVLGLNWVLAIATIVGAVATAIMAFK